MSSIHNLIGSVEYKNMSETISSSSSARHSSKRSSSSRMINLVARTLAGSEYKVQVGAKATVRELKHKLCEQAKGFSVDEMRLLKGPVTLADDSKTLAEVRHACSICVIRFLCAYFACFVLLF